MNIMILGSGGREHTLAWKIEQSKHVENLFIAPGNAGTNSLGCNLDINPSDFNAIKSAVLEHKVSMVIVGPEAPLVDGIVDFFQNDQDLKNIAIVGPGSKGATLEGSKDFAKEFMQKHNIPTARYKSFTKETIEEGYKFLEDMKPPYVLKADGLAAGKGVLILEFLDRAKRELKEMFSGKFGNAGETVVVEEFLSGIEVSYFVYTDGKDYVMLPEAKDYKKIGEGDTGLNTGGMGSISPVPFCDEVFTKKVVDQVIEPTIEGLQKEEIPFNGFIFFGLMNVEGNPYVIEYNVRLGDPETEAILPRIESDLVDMFLAGQNGTLKDYSLNTTSDVAVSVMLVSGGYPEIYEKGKAIHQLSEIDDSLVLHAGTKVEDGKIVTNGGRVMAITALRPTLKEALSAAMKNVEKIDFDKKYYRTDIGFDLQ